MVNGYVTLDLASNNIYSESIKAKASGKPILVVDAPQVYFADTIKVATIDDDKVVVITKGGKTITINDANAVSSEGDIQKHLYGLTINYSDGYATLLVDKDFGNYTIDDSSNITNDDVNFLKSLKGHIILPTCLNAYNGTEGTYSYAMLTTNDWINLRLDTFKWQINLNAPASSDSNEEIAFITNKLF